MHDLGTAAARETVLNTILESAEALYKDHPFPDPTEQDKASGVQPFDPEYISELGYQLYFARLMIEMDLDKQYVQSLDDCTEHVVQQWQDSALPAAATPDLCASDGSTGAPTHAASRAAQGTLGLLYNMWGRW